MHRHSWQRETSCLGELTGARDREKEGGRRTTVDGQGERKKIITSRLEFNWKLASSSSCSYATTTVGTILCIPYRGQID